VLKKKNLRFKKEDLNCLDYKNKYLKSYIMDSGKKIIPRRITGLSSANQKKLSKEIKRARFLALLPYCDKYDHL
jgi:small subunit ribosomal protein S18